MAIKLSYAGTVLLPVYTHSKQVDTLLHSAHRKVLDGDRKVAWLFGQHGVSIAKE